VSDTPQQPDTRAPGLFAALQGLLATLLAIAHTRLELIGTELQEDIARLGMLLLWGCVALFFASLGIALLALTVLLVFWDSHRLAVATGMTLVFLSLAAWAGVAVARLLRARPMLFEASLRELKRDHAQLAPRE
jgi:uncharacterized membrane protein YqjE